MNVLIAGQKHFGAEVLRALRAIDGIRVACVSAPIPGGKADRLAAEAELWRIPNVPAGTLNASTVPDGIDLIVAAHSHDFVGERTRLRATYGGIGYHPSLLPVHRGRDAIRWALRMGDRITGGTVYRLSNKTDGGNILAQEHVFVRPGDDATRLWREALLPLGVRLITQTVMRFRDEGWVEGEPQDERLATWEPSIDRPPLARPDLRLIGWRQ